MTTGTAELLRLPEVQACIKSDFILLPCDLICELPGESLLEAWMVSQAALGGSAEDHNSRSGRPAKTTMLGAENRGRRGGLGVWYETRGREESVKGEVTDFVATAPLEQDEAPVVYPPVEGPGSIRYNLSKLVYAMPMDSLKEQVESDKAFLVRHSLVQTHARVKMLSTYRDAHTYIFPYWVKELAKRNEKFQSVSEDLIGWWAKAGWQKGLGEKLGFSEILSAQEERRSGPGAVHRGRNHLEDEINLQAMSTTKTDAPTSPNQGNGVDAPTAEPRFASRVNTTVSELDGTEAVSGHVRSIDPPPMLAYIHSSQPTAPLVRRVDTSALLLSVSLRLAKLESIEETGGRATSPFAHAHKIAYPAGIAQRCTVTKADCLLAENVMVEEKCVIKESVVGANSHIASGARLTRCVIMDGAVIGERCQLTGCIIGRRSKIGRESVLKDCEVQDGNVVPDETDAKNEKFMVFEGLDEESTDADVDRSGEEDGDEGPSGDFGARGQDLGF